MTDVDTSDLEKSEVLAALYNASSPQGQRRQVVKAPLASLIWMRQVDMIFVASN